MKKLNDLLIVIFYIIIAFTIFFCYLYFILCVVFWEWNYQEWTNLIVDGGLVLRLTLVLLYLIFKK
jgi:hypothetical protein